MGSHVEDLKTMLRLLIADGNAREARASRKAQTGRTSSEDYARVVSEIEPSAACELIYPADADVSLPAGVGLRDIDGLIYTGSTLRISDPVPAVARQIALMRAALSAGVSVFGSCWGLHVATAACGGDVGPSDLASEYAFSRGIRRVGEGETHPLLVGRAARWDAPAIHADVVKAPPPNATVLACNELVPVQALSVSAGDGMFWGTQYHPELDLDALATMLAASSDDVVKSSQAPDKAWVEHYARQISAVGEGTADAALMAELEIGADLATATMRRIEVANYLRLLMSARA